MTQQKAKKIAMDWGARCANSNGSMVLVPKSMKEKAAEMVARSNEYIQRAQEFDKYYANYEHFAKNFWHEMRMSLEAEGIKDIFSKNIGWNEEAQRDGEQVINIIAAQPTQMR